ncbi:c-type cytochrome [Cupriavidus necator]|nr:cytochrome c [Cupriavidus necator]
MFTTARCVRNVVLLCIIYSGGGQGLSIAADSVRTFGFGAPATEKDLAGFISPLPDGRGLPKGAGSAKEGKEIFQQKCAACHGVSLEGGIADRLIGGRGTLVNNDPTKAPVKTVESYWPYATTLFDYIKRAMPFNAPGSLTNNEVYALSAYILSEGKIIDSTSTLSDKTLANVRMPNRDGFIPDPRNKKP